jgi:hypothetical protein
MNMKCSEKFETFEIWAMFTLEGPHIVMSRTDAQNGLDFHFNPKSLIRNRGVMCQPTKMPRMYFLVVYLHRNGKKCVVGGVVRTSCKVTSLAGP